MPPPRFERTLSATQEPTLTVNANFRLHLESSDSPKGFDGVCCSNWLWFDIDRDELDAATFDARKIAAFLVERFGFDSDDLLLFFSGRKGYHVGLPLALCGSPPPAVDFHRTCRRFAEQLAIGIGVAIDAGVYDKVRLFRAPNSRHPKTGLHKRRLSFDELLHLRTEAIVQLAATPEPFDIPAPTATNPQAVEDWTAATADVRRAANANAERHSRNATLNRSTIAFIRDGATIGDRHRLLFSSAANLAEFDCPSDLAFALLAESALDSGLPPSDVRRQIECGLNSRPKGNA